jgi:hypothetical protein
MRRSIVKARGTIRPLERRNYVRKESRSLFQILRPISPRKISITKTIIIGCGRSVILGTYLLYGALRSLTEVSPCSLHTVAEDALGNYSECNRYVLSSVIHL